MKQLIPENIETLISKVYSSAQIEDICKLVTNYKAIYVLYDKQVTTLTNQIVAVLDKEYPSLCQSKFEIIATEENKNITTVTNICEWLLESNADRNALLLVVGGGLTTDLGGFAASIYKRGIDFAYIPTTLLGQVDAAIGGKTGVNLNSYKNIVGTIIQPKFTFLCPQPLLTLPYEIFKDGLAELFKTFIIEDALTAAEATTFGNTASQFSQASLLFSMINSSEDKLQSISSNMAAIFPFVASAAKVKIGVVSRDEFEAGERRNLNLGHTFAHSIEKLSKHSISHGSAVSMGMVMAAKLSASLGKCGQELVNTIETTLEAVGLPVKAPYNIDELSGAMRKDKKAEGNEIYFILPSSIGQVIQVKMDLDEMLTAYNSNNNKQEQNKI